MDKIDENWIDVGKGILRQKLHPPDLVWRILAKTCRGINESRLFLDG